LTTAISGRVRLVLLTLALLAASACVHTPVERSAAPAQSVINVPAAPAAAETTAASGSGAQLAGAPTAAQTSPAPAIPGAADAGVTPPSDPSAGAAQAADLAPAQYADLFDRMRAGFKLEDTAEHRAIDEQLRFYAGNPAYLQRAFGRADLYLYHIVTQLEARGMPLELALLPVVESAFEPYAYSRARASGLWQFIPGTGSRFGLKQDWWYDGRRDVVESTRAALDYLQYLHDEFNGDWLLAIAAYNCGEATVERELRANRAAGRPTDFWALRLPRETRAYVPKLLAMKRLVRDPGAYGLSMSPIPNQPYFARVATLGQVNLKIAGQIANVSPDELYELNPAFHRWATDPSGPHFLLLPVDSADVFATSVAQLSADQRLGATHYSVNPGDSVASVAAQFHTTVNVIRELNDFPIGRLTVGMDLRVPSAVPELPAKVVLAAARIDGRDRAARRPHVQIVRRGDSLWAIARRHGMNVDTLAMMNGLHPGDTLRAGQRIRLAGDGAGDSGHARSGRRVFYTVRQGDTMVEIAQQFQCSVPQLRAWNGLGAHSPIHAGQKLRVHTVRHG
jgi:membrane-bound lytic murein transglycosylase D